MRTRSLAAFGGAAFLLLAGTDVARAESPTVRLTRQLNPSFGSPLTHPLADSRGNIPFLVELDPNEDAASLGLREVAPGIAEGRLDPDVLFDFSQDHPGRRMSVTPRLQTQLEEGRARSGVQPFVDRSGVASRGAGVVVGIVDTGIDLSHDAFRNEDGTTRVAWLLTWGDPTGNHPDLEEKFGCTDPDTPCAIYSSEDIDAFDEDDFARPDVRDLVGHGTHVAGIAAGNGRRESGKDPRNIGMAPDATLVIVAPSESGGFGDSEVLLGASFIFDRAEELEMPAVVNLSLGGDFGPHDGTSLLEKGTAAFIGDDQPGRVIVAAAGNSGGLYRLDDIQPLGIHTEVHVEPHAPADVPILVPGAEGGNVYVWITFRPEDEVSVGLDGPGGSQWIGLIEPGDEAGYKTDEANAAVINNLVNDNSSISSETNSAVVAFYGSWEKSSTFTIRLEGKGDAQLWVVGQGEADNGAFFVHATKEGTINQPASHPQILAVGCTINRDRWLSSEAGAVVISEIGGQELNIDAACDFSAAGPTPLGVAKPEIAAPGAFVVSSMSRDADPRVVEGGMFSSEGCPDGEACYVVDDTYAVASGTSMSSPFVTGAVALLLEKNPNLTQARAIEILQASARRPTGPVPYGSQIGAGALDLRHALDVLEEDDGTSGTPPDVDASFWYLSSESARPDPSWTLTGTVQLRHADGSIASGLGGDLLTVEVDGGLLVRPALKVDHGLFQFAVAAARGTGGNTMRVRVYYDGELIGSQAVLPIAIDEWAADGDPSAAGGLDCTASPARSHGSSTWVGLALAGLAVCRTRRRARR